MRYDMDRIAAAYERAPVLDDECIPAWRELADHCVRTAEVLRRVMVVQETTADMPYSNAERMFDDIDSNHFIVSVANCDHPVWTPDENVAFRICHDVMGHYAAGRVFRDPAGFDWEGECSAFLFQRRVLPWPSLARLALFTEVLGQAAHGITRGAFGVQKVAFLNLG